MMRSKQYDKTFWTALEDIQAVKNDPSYKEAERIARLAVEEYHESGQRNTVNERYIKESLANSFSDEIIDKEIIRIEEEIKNNNLDEVTREWVSSWENDKGRDRLRDKKRQEIRDFVSSSLENTGKISEKPAEISMVKSKAKVYIIRSLSVAAALMGVIFLVRSILLPVEPENLYSKYYEPVSLVSDITRGTGGITGTALNIGIENYRNGEYESASAVFADLMDAEKPSPDIQFYQGVTQMALGNFSDAINLLDLVVANSGSFSKEAEWYLALSYLKTGNTFEAIRHFGTLANEPGYYKERSEKILRRLK